MTAFESDLEQRLAQIREEGLRRELRPIDSPQGPRIVTGGKSLLNFSSNDYLGLAAHPTLKQAAIAAVEKFGTGSGASRLICGSLRPHHELEETIAQFKGTKRALVFSSGYSASIGTLGALVGSDDVVIIDKLVHASIVDAARLSGARLRVYQHNDLHDLEKILSWAAQRNQAGSGRGRTLIVTESVFSMDGDFGALRELVELKDRFGVWLMIDEAHATGLFGARRSGLAEAFDLSHRVEVQMGTLGKSVGASGGYICGDDRLIELLINRARSFIFSTAPPPAAAAAAAAGIRLIQSEEGEERRVRVWALVDCLKNRLIKLGFQLPAVRSAIIPLILGREDAAVEWSRQLGERGIFVPAIRYPTVARGEARLRLTVTASHSESDLDQLAQSLEAIRKSTA